MTSAPFAEIVVAVHDARRPIRRAVASLLADGAPVSVLVVAHGLPAADIAAPLEGLDPSRFRVVDYADGIRSAAGPFNHGLAISRAEYVGVMGSDDFAEPGAPAAWVDWARRERPDAVLVPLRHQAGELLHNPLTRLGRTRRLDPVRDRLFYRSAPLGLLRRDRVEGLGLRFTEGLRTGDDLEFSARMWTDGGRIDFARGAPAYVIGADARERVTTARMGAAEQLRAVELLVTAEWVARAPGRLRQALLTKLARIHVLDAMAARPDAEDWTPADVAEIARIMRMLLAAAPGALAAFARADRARFDAILAADASPESVAAALARASRLGRFATIVPRNPLRLLDREGTAVRYARYAVEGR